MKYCIAFILLVLVLCACQTPDQVITTFTVLYNDNPTSPYSADWLILDEYLKVKNVQLDIQPVMDDAYGQALEQTLNSGKIPDIIVKCWPNQVEEYSSKRLLLPFSDYMKQMPHFQKYITDNNLASEIEKLRLDNGKFYILPGYKRPIQVQQWIYRKDLFDKHKLGQPSSYEELLEDLIELKKIYPSSTPLTASWGGAHLLSMMAANYNITGGWSGWQSYNEELDYWQYAPATENYREMVLFLSQAYNEGVLDYNLFRQSEREYLNKLVTNMGFVTVSWVSSGFDSWNQELADNGFPQANWEPLPVMNSTIGTKALPPADPFRKGIVVPATVANEPYFEKLLSFLDWAVYSSEGRGLTYWGKEGLTFDEDESGKHFLDSVKTPSNPQGSVDIRKEYGFNQIFNHVENKELEDSKKPLKIVSFLERSLQENETLPLDPHLKLSDEANKICQLIEKDLNTYVEDMRQKFITGNLDISSYWPIYIEEIKDLGYLTLESIWNDYWLKSQK